MVVMEGGGGGEEEAGDCRLAIGDGKRGPSRDGWWLFFFSLGG